MEEKKKISLKIYIISIIILLIVIVGLIVIIIKQSNENKETLTDENTTSIEQKIENNKETKDDENVTENLKSNETNISNDNRIKLLQFDSNFYNLEDIAKDYRKSEQIKNYKDFEYDLDGDYTIDKITIELDRDANNEENYIFKLNDNIFAESFFSPEIYIVDLNKNDNSIEVIIYDDGPSDDPNYTIYSKQGSEMKRIETLYGFDLKIDTNGKIVIANLITDTIKPSVFDKYYEFTNGNIEIHNADIKNIQNTTFSIESSDFVCFTEDLKNLDKYFEIESNYDEETKLKKASIEKLNSNNSFTILGFTDNQEIHIKLSDGREGYAFHKNGHLAG